MSTDRFHILFNTIIKISIFVLVLFAAWYIGVFIINATARLSYPYVLYWYEDQNLHQVQRILSGKKLYVAPTIEYIPFIYGPVFYYVAALFSFIFGMNFTPLRFVSILATASSVWIIIMFVWKETQRFSASWIAASLFIGTYYLTKKMFDLGRIDSLHLFFMLASLWFMRFGKTKKDQFLAAFAISLAFFTKQTTLLVLIPMIGYYFFVLKKFRMIFISSSICLIILGVTLLNIYFDGWYFYYTFLLPSKHTVLLLKGLILWGFLVMVFLPLPFTCSLYVIYSKIKSHSDPHSRFFYLFAFLSMNGLSFAALINLGGDISVLLPAYAITAVCFGIALGYILTLSSKTKDVQTAFKILFIIILFVPQFILMSFNPFQMKLIPPFSAIPDKLYKEEEKLLLQRVHTIKGDIFMTSNHRNLLDIVGKKQYAHLHTINELLGYFGDKKPTKEGKNIGNTFKTMITHKKFGAIILSSPEDTIELMNPFLPEINRNYKKSKDVYHLDGTTYYVYIPK